MKLTLTPDELKAGERIARYGPKRLAEIIDLCVLKPPVKINPISEEGKTIRVVVLRKISSTEKLKHKLEFVPVYGRAFKACGKDGDLKMIIVDFGVKQLSFDANGWKHTTFRTSGPGVDTEACDPEEDFSKLIDHDEAPCKTLRRYLSTTYGK